MGRKNKKYYSKSNQKNQTAMVNVYPQSVYEQDENNFTQGLKTGNINWNSFERLLTRDLVMNNKIIDSGFFGDVSFEDIKQALEYPRQGWRTILGVSEKLMRISPHYYRLNQFYSNMALFNWGIDLYDVKENVNMATLKKQYSVLATKLENMHLKHEFSKIMKVLPYRDIFCGLLIENQNDFFIQEVNYNICKLYQVQDGLFNFIINLSAIKPQNLNAYPDYVQQAYIDWKDNKQNNNNLYSEWYEPPVDKQICIKLNTQWTYPYPLLIGLIKDILDLDIYKKLKLQSARTDNYKAILMEIPIDKNTVDKPLLTPETLAIFAQLNRENINDDIGMLYTLGSSGEAVSFKDSNNTRNNVSDAVDEIYNSSGETKELYNGSSSATAVNISLENSSGFIYGLYRQFERWVNRYIKLKKFNKSTFKFYFYILDMTIFNRDTVTGRYKDAVALGATVIDKWMASLNMTPSRMLGSYIVNKEIFNFVNEFEPLSSSYNSSSTTTDENQVGRPTNASKGELLDETGEQTADSDANKDR